MLLTTLFPTLSLARVPYRLFEVESVPVQPAAGQTTTAGLVLKGGAVNLGINYSGNVAFCNCSLGVEVAARSLKAPGIQIVNCNTGLRVSGGTAELDSLVVANCSEQGIDCSGGYLQAIMATSQRNGARKTCVVMAKLRVFTRLNTNQAGACKAIVQKLTILCEPRRQEH